MGVLAGATRAGFVVGKTFLPELLCCSTDLPKSPSEAFLLVFLRSGASDLNAFLRLLPPAQPGLAISALCNGGSSWNLVTAGSLLLSVALRWLVCETCLAVTGALRTPGVLGSAFALITDLVGSCLKLDLLMGCMLLLVVGRAGVGMLFSTVAILVEVLAVTGGKSVEENGRGRKVVIAGRSLLSWGEREECLARFILFIS